MQDLIKELALPFSLSPPLFMPVVWIVVATLVALALYKTSGAVVEQVVKSDAQQRSVRLVGSVAIAIVVFVLLWRVTPALDLAPGDVTIRKDRAVAISLARDNFDGAWTRLDACAEMTPPSQCVAERADMKAAADQYRVATKGLFDGTKGQ